MAEGLAKLERDEIRSIRDLAVIARSEATKQSSFGALERLDCFASLAMTSLHYYITPT